MLFSAPHVMAVIIIAAICILLYIFRDVFRGEVVNRRIRILLALVLIFQELSFHIWNIAAGLWTVGYALPLQLCGVSTILSAVMLVSKSYSLYEVAYFWGIGGAAQAIITPEIGLYTYPHFRFFQFFLCHGAIIIACLFMTFVNGYRPKFRSVWKAIVSLNIYAVFVGIFNTIIGANYLFICWKPEVSSIMDYLGPWPWYLISLELVAAAIFYILYLPFAVKQRVYRDSTKANHISFP